MSAPHKKAVETRRLYQFERVFMHPTRCPRINRPRSIRWLKGMAARVREKHGRKNLQVPKIHLWDRFNYSYCVGYSSIVLSTRGDTRESIPHNTLEVLLHELVHAIGYRNHDRAFVRKYVELLVEYGGMDEGELRLGMGLFRIEH